MRKITVSVVVGIILLLLFAAYFSSWWKSNISPVNELAEPVSFVVLKGRTAEQVGESLYQKGLIRNPLTFKIYVQFFDKAENINAGQFRLSGSMSLPEIVNALQGGPLELWVTIPEGLRREEIAERVIENLSLSGNQAVEYRTNFLAYTKGMEGYLFPDTYLFPPDVKAEVVADRLSETFEEKTSDIDFDNQENKHTIVIIASLIEREAITDGERPVIAGILYNRLDLGMPLQVDATVQYVLGKPGNWWPQNLTRKDLRTSSPYNTYEIQGLPPSPIANPGLSSLQAAAQPQDTDYLYYIHDSEGQIHYAETLSQHNRNVSNYLNK